MLRSLRASNIKRMEEGDRERERNTRVSFLMVARGIKFPPSSASSLVPEKGKDIA